MCDMLGPSRLSESCMNGCALRSIGMDITDETLDCGCYDHGRVKCWALRKDWAGQKSIEYRQGGLNKTQSMTPSVDVGDVFSGDNAE